MIGNAWEWCADWYDKDCYENSSKVDPAGPASGSYRVLRGGCWCYSPVDCRSASRIRSSPGSRYGDILGFRIVVNLDEVILKAKGWKSLPESNDPANTFRVPDNITAPLIDESRDDAALLWIAILRDQDNGKDMRATAANKLGKVGKGSKKAVSALVEAIRDKDPDVATWSAAALSDIGPEAIPALAEAMKDENVIVRRAAVWAIENMQGDITQASAALKVAAGGQDMATRMYATEALKRVRTPPPVEGPKSNSGTKSPTGAGAPTSGPSAGGAGRIVKVTVQIAGATPDVMDATVAIRLDKAIAVGGVGIVHHTTICSQGKAELYIEADKTADANGFLTRVKEAVQGAVPRLPDAVEATSISVAWMEPNATVPAVEANEIDEVQVNVDRDKIHALGLSLADVEKVLSDANLLATAEGLRRASGLTVANSAGLRVPLTSVAAFKIVRAPSHVVRMDFVLPQFPEATQPAAHPAMSPEDAARRALLAKAQTVPRIGVYMVTNTNDTHLAEKAALDSLELAKDPALRDDDFVSYDGNARTLIVSGEAARRFPRGTSVWGTPYVVVVEGRRWFLGTYMPLGSSYAPSVPVAGDDVAEDGIGTRALKLKMPNPDDVDNPAFRAKIMDALKAVGQQPATPSTSTGQAQPAGKAGDGSRPLGT